jgi:hypothetical protein
MILASSTRARTPPPTPNHRAIDNQPPVNGTIDIKNDTRAEEEKEMRCYVGAMNRTWVLSEQ